MWIFYGISPSDDCIYQNLGLHICVHNGEDHRGDTIDSPGKYTETKNFGVGLACFSFEADYPFNLFSPGLHMFILRLIIGIITKIDSPHSPTMDENPSCKRIFYVRNRVREGIRELIEYLQDDYPPFSQGHVKLEQALGLKDWDPLPQHDSGLSSSTV